MSWRRSPLLCLALLCSLAASGSCTVHKKAPVITGLNIKPEQVEILKLIQKHFNTSMGPALPPSIGWSEPWSCVDTAGVVCDARGNIIKLILSGQPSSGCMDLPLNPETEAPMHCPLEYLLQNTIPPVIGRLTTLTKLDLSGNQFNGTIPRTLFNLTNLVELKLDTNPSYDPEASIPLDISKLTKLKYLNLGYTPQLSQPPPVGISALTKLTFLNLYASGIVGTLPASYSTLRELRNVEFAGNNVNGNIPESWSTLTNMYSLGLQQNRLTGPIPTFLATFTDLVVLKLSKNKLQGPVPSELGNLKNLQFLDLSYNKGLNGVLPTSLAELDNIIVPDTSANLGNGWILLTNTSTTCPSPSKGLCMGPPVVNATSEFCLRVCYEFCSACDTGNYTAANSPGAPAGDQTVISWSPPPPASPGSPPPDYPPPESPVIGLAADPPAPSPPPSGSAAGALASVLLTALAVGTALLF